ncbi:MAG: glycosyltransferase [Novipirellula sp. JB048]
MSLQVSMVNTHVVGGAAAAALRLHHALRSIGVNSQFVNDQLDAPSSAIVKGSRTTSSLIQRAKRKTTKILGQTKRHSLDLTEATRVKPECDTFSDARVDNPIVLNSLSNSDLIHLHWIAQFVDIASLVERFAGTKPLVWTLHDMNAFTGGCHYSYDCTRYVNQCNHCPLLVHSGRRDASSVIWQRKKIALERISTDDLQIVTPSEWLSTEARRSELLGRFEVNTIPYGLNTSLFHPVEEKVARNALQIPEDQFSVLFVADNVTNYRKGFDFLHQAMATFSEHVPNVGLISAGNGDVASLSNRGEVVSFGHISNERIMSLIYSAADVLAIPSRQDNLPNTVLESMACGTPVVGFATGGIPDMVRESSTGWLADEVSASGLVSALTRAYQDLHSPAIRAKIQFNCRTLVEQEYNVELQARRYKTLYDEHVAKRNTDMSLNARLRHQLTKTGR